MSTDYARRGRAGKERGGDTEGSTDSLSKKIRSMGLIYTKCLKSQTLAAKKAILGESSRCLPEVAAPVCKLAAGVVVEAVAEAALT